MNDMTENSETKMETGLPRGGTGDLLLCAEGLRKSFGGQVVLDGVSLELHRGEVVLLRGENGSGKTTLLNILTGNLKPESGMIELYMNGKEKFSFPRGFLNCLYAWHCLTPERMAMRGIGRTWQEIRLFPTLSLRDNIGVATLHQIGENAAWAVLRRPAVLKQEGDILINVDQRLHELGLKERKDSYADQISLGQSKRVAIARALQAGAEMLFLDEPLAGLDSRGIADVLNMLNSLARDKQVTLVIVEHLLNIPKILDMATTIWTLENGKVVVEDSGRVWSESAYSHSSDIQGLLKKIVIPDSQIAEKKLPNGALLTTFEGQSLNSRSVLLEIEDLVVCRGSRLVIGQKANDKYLDGISLTLRTGQIGILEAPNGWGKTTLLQAISGILPVTKGSIRLNGKSIQMLPSWERARFGVSLSQFCSSSFPSLTVQEVFQLFKVNDIPQSLSHLTDMLISNLSGGERQKVMLAYVHGKSSVLLMLDEPFSGLDSSGIQQFLASLRSYRDTIVLIVVPSSRKGEVL